MVLAGMAGVVLLTWYAWNHFTSKATPPALPAAVTKRTDVARGRRQQHGPDESARGVKWNFRRNRAGPGQQRERIAPGWGNGIWSTFPANIGGKDCRRFEAHRNARCYFQIAPASKRPAS